MHGTYAGSRNVTIRRNVLYDGSGGIAPESYYKIYHNTIIYNNRDYTGANSSWTGSDIWPSFIGINAIFDRTGVGIKNNIVGGHHGAEINLARGSTALDLDYNLYFNTIFAVLSDWRGAYDWSLVSFRQWPALLQSLGVPGSDAHSLHVLPLLVYAPVNLTGSHTNFDFHLQSGSRAIDHGGYLTTTTAAGQGTSIPVADAGYFFDGFGVFDADSIQLQGQTVPAKILSINGNTLVVDQALTWSAGQGVSLPYQGSAPDMGAYEYGGSSPTTYTLTVSATNGTVTKTPARPAIPPAQRPR
jgi:hypothetical protein